MCTVPVTTSMKRSGVFTYSNLHSITPHTQTRTQLSNEALAEVGILKRFAVSPRLVLKTTKMTSQVLKSAFPHNNVGFCLPVIRIIKTSLKAYVTTIRYF